MHHPDFCRGSHRRFLRHNCTCDMYVLLPLLWRSTIIQQFCSPPQMQLVRYQVSQGATRARVVSSSSYHFFFCAHSNWVGEQKHTHVQMHADRCSLGLLTLTLIRAIQNWRITTSRLYIVLVNHNVLYYICGLCESTLACAVFPCLSMVILFPEVFSVANIFTSLLLHVRGFPECLYDLESLIH
jgi:hypothetical protein